MAIVWSQRTGDDLHEVRTAGKSVRLYTNGVFHSQWNPNRLLTRSVWDSLMISAFFVAPETLRRVLILGVGGGVVIKQFNELFPAVDIVGVELDPMHIEIAQKWFDIRKSDATLIQADAQEWLYDYDGPKFDLIIDDLFGDADGQVARAVAVDKDWAGHLCKHVSDVGVLTVNFIGKPELRNSGLYQRKQSNKQMQFNGRYCFTPPFCDNAVSVFIKNDTTIQQWKNRITDHSAFTASQKKAILGDPRRSF
jgi:spermidine synthase